MSLTLEAPVPELPTLTSVPTTRKRQVHYPERDGNPGAETDLHITQLLHCRDVLRQYFSNRASEVYVSGNNFLYYEEGNPKARVSPDGYVVFGVEQKERRSYKTWEENGKLPSIVFEFTSQSTKREDLSDKMTLYENLGIAEYVLFDPQGDYLPAPHLRLYRLDPSIGYVLQPVVNARVRSTILDLDLVATEHKMRLWNPQTQEFLPTLHEAMMKASTEMQRADAEKQRADALEVELARLREQLAKK
jgi:Uma2 family endonuclease